MRTGSKGAYHLCLRTELGKYLTAGSLIPSASYKHAAATTVIKGKFLAILDTLPLLLVTLEKPGHRWALIVPRVQEECQQLLRIILPPLPAAAEPRSHPGGAVGASPRAIPVRPCPCAPWEQAQSPRGRGIALKAVCHSPCGGCRGLPEGALPGTALVQIVSARSAV